MTSDQSTPKASECSLALATCSATPWTDDKENGAMVFDHAGQPYEMLPFVLSSDCRIFERRVRAEIARLTEALEIIAGMRPCLDNLMGNADIARAALLPNVRDEPRAQPARRVLQYASDSISSFPLSCPQHEA